MLISSPCARCIFVCSVPKKFKIRAQGLLDERTHAYWVGFSPPANVNRDHAKED